MTLFLVSWHSLLLIAVYFFQGIRKGSDVDKKDRAIALALREEGNKAFR